MGLVEADAEQIGATVTGFRRIGLGRADSMVLMLIAKHADTSDDDLRRQLGTIAAGGGRVSELLQIQAAWLYLKHSGSLEQALGRLFSEH